MEHLEVIDKKVKLFGIIEVEMMDADGKETG